MMDESGNCLKLRIRAAIIPTLVFVGLFVSWEIAARIGLYNTIVLPPPSEAVSAIGMLWEEGMLFADVAASMNRYIPGFLIGSFAGILAGIVTGLSKNIGYAVNPLFHYLRSIPPVALIPFILVIFGITDAGKVSLVAWSCMFPVWLSTQAGVARVPVEYLRAARIFRANSMQQVFHIWLPCSLPYIISGIKIAVATGLFALTAAEMFAASSGIGFRIVYSHQLFQTDKMLGMILFLGMVAFLADRLLSFAGRLIARWEVG